MRWRRKKTPKPDLIMEATFNRELERLDRELKKEVTIRKRVVALNLQLNKELDQLKKDQKRTGIRGELDEVVEKHLRVAEEVEAIKKNPDNPYPEEKE
jgi:hypothetical protein